MNEKCCFFATVKDLADANLLQTGCSKTTEALTPPPKTVTHGGSHACVRVSVPSCVFVRVTCPSDAHKCRQQQSRGKKLHLHQNKNLNI